MSAYLELIHLLLHLGGPNTIKLYFPQAARKDIQNKN